jgi:hypothetical protein
MFFVCNFVHGFVVRFHGNQMKLSVTYRKVTEVNGVEIYASIPLPCPQLAEKVQSSTA